METTHVFGDGEQVARHQAVEKQQYEPGDDEGLQGVAQQDQDGLFQQVPVDGVEAGDHGEGTNGVFRSPVPMRDRIVPLDGAACFASADLDQQPPVFVYRDVDNVGQLLQAFELHLEQLDVGGPYRLRQCPQVHLLDFPEVGLDAADVLAVLTV